ncbi:MAG: argininosuccinate lyase [Bogoriella megaspora]|nr:MAG: argininosuccinate lyase [Bogoriella megaspora]
MASSQEEITSRCRPLMIPYNASLRFDRAFYRQDIRGSIAYTCANTKPGILTTRGFSEIERGFQQIEKEWATNTFDIHDDIDEDIHTANEHRFGEINGKDTAG